MFSRSLAGCWSYPKLSSRVTLSKWHFRQATVPFAVWPSFCPQEASQNRAACNPFGSSPWRMKTTPDCSRLWNHFGTRLLLGRASPAPGKVFSDRESLSCRPLSHGETASPPPRGHRSLAPSPTQAFFEVTHFPE